MTTGGSILGRLKAAWSNDGPPAGLVWHPSSGNFPRLASLDTAAYDLAGRPGLYLLWHLGVRPQWLHVAFTQDLDVAGRTLAATPEIAAYAAHDGPFFGWMFCDAEKAHGFVAFLVSKLRPALQSLPVACDAPCDPAAPPQPCPFPRGTRFPGAG